ncbi:MAG: glycosyltransferase family 4 protein [Vicinamibacterales bacterium]
MAKRRLLSIGHSYIVDLNRRLPAEIARLSPERWDVTVVMPERLAGGPGDLRPLRFHRSPGEPFRAVPINAYGTRFPHMMVYGARLARTLRERWDLVHVWEEPYVLAGAQVAALAPRSVPLVYLTYQNIAKRYPLPFCWAERYSLRRASAWIPGGHTVLGALAERPGYRERPRSIITLGVDTSRFCPDPVLRSRNRAALGWDVAGPPVVGYLGRFVPEKGVDFLVRVLRRVRAEHRVLFVGGGAGEGRLREWAESSASHTRIVTGAGHDDVPGYLNAMDLLCAPSQTTPRWREQFGRMVVEAFAAGVPVLSSDSGELPYVVGDAGRLLPEADEDAWVEAVDELLESPEKRKRMREAGLARARDMYDWAVIARAHDAFFSQVLAGSRFTPS